MTRRQIREEVFKMIFRVEFHEAGEIPAQMESFLSEETDLGENRSYIEEKCKAIIENLAQIDTIINEAAEGWKTTRMSKVDLTLIRVAVYEIRFEKLAEGIAIDEAVEIAKKYGEDRSPAFVNGVLSKIVK